MPIWFLRNLKSMQAALHWHGPVEAMSFNFWRASLSDVGSRIFSIAVVALVFLLDHHHIDLRGISSLWNLNRLPCLLLIQSRVCSCSWCVMDSFFFYYLFNLGPATSTLLRIAVCGWVRLELAPCILLLCLSGFCCFHGFGFYSFRVVSVSHSICLIYLFFGSLWWPGCSIIDSIEFFWGSVETECLIYLFLEDFVYFCTFKAQHANSPMCFL